MIRPFSSRIKKGKKHKTFKTLDGKGVVALGYVISPITKNLFFSGVYTPANKADQPVHFAGFVNAEGKQRYGGNCFMSEPCLPFRTEQTVLRSILAGTRWNGFNRNSFKESLP